MAASDDLGARFARDGVVLAKGIFDPDHIKRLAVDFDAIVDRLQASGEQVNARWDSAAEYSGAAETTVVHTHHVQRHSAAWAQALTHEPFLDAAEQLIGSDIVLHHSKLFHKPAGHGSPFPMHQDWRYFPTESDSMIAAVIHVSVATEEMGCLRAVPGSHSIGRRPSTSGRMSWDDPTGYREFLAEFPDERAVHYPADPGDVLFFSYFTVHGSGMNQAATARKTVLVQLFSGTDRLEPESEHTVSGLVLRGHNRHATRSSVVAD